MIALIFFAFVAGAATALSPCVLPVLPVVLSVGVTGARRRPLGVVCGLTLSFAFATVALVYVIDAFGLPDSLLRNLAIAVLLGFGISLLVPSVSARLEAWIGRVVPTPKAGPREGGFFSGLLVGASLGLVYAPCAGPILAGVITVSASQSFTFGRLSVALAYAVGSAAVLYVLMLGGRRLTSRLSRQSGRLQMAMGAVMVVVALGMVADYDTRFQTAIADDLPSFVVNPTRDIEAMDGLRDDLAMVRGERREGLGTATAPARRTASPSGLPVLGAAPDFTGNQEWFNTANGKPLTLAELRGKVVLVDFWTYTCINCIRTLPYLKAWDRRYRDKGLTIVGVHTPEFPFERDAGNVRDAIAQNGLRYPVAQDNDYATWNAYANQYWPAKYLIDARGRVRYTHFGEGDDAKTENAIRGLLAEAGRQPGAGRSHARGEGVAAAATPESYLGAKRADRFVNGPIVAGTKTFELPSGGVPLNGLAYGGSWRIADDGATASRDARLDLGFSAQRVFLVLGSRGGRPRPVRVLLDGEPLPDRLAGSDVHGGRVVVRGQRLYRLADLGRPGEHTLTLDFAPGVSGYAFTFG